MTTIDLIIFVLLCTTLIIIAYHHVGYPVILRELAKRRALSPASYDLQQPSQPLPSMTVIVPARNEENFIAEKIANLAALDYPNDLLTIVIALDGCTDATQEIVNNTLATLESPRTIQVEVYEKNIGKIAVLNEQIARASSDIIVLTDASAVVNADALNRAAAHFASNGVGVVCGTYRLSAAGSKGEQAYWQYQTEIKTREAALAAPMGAHGAFYLFRRNLWHSLPPDTINDDFIIPMRIVAAGYRAIYDKAIIATELERTTSDQEFHRRIRIGAGNLQQTIRLANLASPRNAWLAFLFMSGKGLRPLIPFLVLLAIALTMALAIRAGTLFQLLLAAELSLFALATFAVMNRQSPVPKPVALLGYLVEGHTASFLGALQFMTGRTNRTWQAGSAQTSEARRSFTYIPREVAIAKRTFDIVAAISGILLLSVVALPIAIMIKLESSGPVIYRQRRVGRVTPTATYVFDMMKFRTMRRDAEAATGPVWATKEDPRITRVGNFLRKTRLDELPQLINVLKGDMSLIGPRPERPIFFQNLEDNIPFYGERTFGLRPGITGYAQVNQDYDSTIDDVRNKVLYDHAYAARLTSFSSWLSTDISILLKTFGTVIARKGQ